MRHTVSFTVEVASTRCPGRPGGLPVCRLPTPARGGRRHASRRTDYAGQQGVDSGKNDYAPVGTEVLLPTAMRRAVQGGTRGGQRLGQERPSSKASRSRTSLRESSMRVSGRSRRSNRSSSTVPSGAPFEGASALCCPPMEAGRDRGVSSTIAPQPHCGESVAPPRPNCGRDARRTRMRAAHRRNDLIRSHFRRRTPGTDIHTGLRTNGEGGASHGPHLQPEQRFSASANFRVSRFSAQRQRRQLTAPSLEPAVTSSFHPPKAAKTSPFSRSGTLK